MLAEDKNKRPPGRPSTWPQEWGAQDTTSIRVPKYLSHQLKQIAFQIDAGDQVEIVKQKSKENTAAQSKAELLAAFGLN